MAIDDLFSSSLSLVSYAFYLNMNEKRSFISIYQICRSPLNSSVDELLQIAKELGYSEGINIFRRNNMDFYLRQNNTTQKTNLENFRLFQNGYVVFSYSHFLPFYNVHCVIRSHHGRLTQVDLQDSN